MARRKTEKTVATAAKSAPVAKEKVSKAKGEIKELEALYAQFNTLAKRKKVSKRDIASKISMSYQGFLNSYNNRNLKIDTWMEISKVLDIPFVAKFETAKQAAQAEVMEAPVAAKPAESTDFTAMKLDNAEDKISILERQIASLESQLKDKQTIIDLLGEKVK
ncbi:MAG: hypothetical protein EP332_00635 [Bacteroidetes bacterium]|nr:MAG: hypothetical protein EP332_00635 [Bacteroidota bacterium]